MQRLIEDGGVVIEGNPATNTEGTPVRGAWLQAIDDELIGLVENTGETLNPEDNGQIAKGIQSGKLISSVAGGTADALTGTFTPIIETLINNMVLCVRAAGANTTTAVTFTPNPGVIAPVGVYKGANVVLAMGDIAGAGHGLKFRWDATLTKWELLNPATGISIAAPNFKNKLPNGAFRINQRKYISGTALAPGVPLTGVGYGHDGWRAGAGGCTYTFAQSMGPTQINITAGTLISVAEDSTVDGTAMVLSWGGSAQGRVGVNGAAPSGAYAASPITLTATPGQTVSVEFNTGTLGKVDLRNGLTPSADYEWPPLWMVLAVCQRYLPAFNTPSGQVGSVNWVSSTAFQANFSFPVTARAVPSTISVSSIGHFVANTPGGSNNVCTGVFAYWIAGLNSFSVTGTVAGGGGTLGTGGFLYAGNGSAQILFFGCEL